MVVAVRVPVVDRGPYVGGRNFQKLGIAKAFPDDDKGRIAVTRQAADEKVFKVPSLRNIEKTGPYFHNGAVNALDDAVRSMAEHQLGKKLTDTDVAMIVTWLAGLYLAWAGHWFTFGWLHVKLALVLALSGVHGFFSRWVKDFAADRRPRSQKFYRLINEVPTILMIFIVIMVIVKPF